MIMFDFVMQVSIMYVDFMYLLNAITFHYVKI